ncbi:MAG: hypothetical protein WKF89_07050 [Chitinophagaceae bacterium]
MAKEKKPTKKKVKTKRLQLKSLFSKRKRQSPAGASTKKQTEVTGLESSQGGPPPFTFIITIVINPTMIIKSANLDGVIATKDNFKVAGENIICEIQAPVSTFTFLLIIEAEGDADTITTFNLTCDNKKVFGEDQVIRITSTGRGGYTNKEIPLP